MRKFVLALFSLATILSVISCTDEDTQWRNDNLAFFDGLSKYCNKDTVLDADSLCKLGDVLNGYPGIYYQVLQKGTGTIPLIGNQVNCYYAGWLWNDTTHYNSPLDLDDAFDYNNTDGIEFKVGASSVITGWDLILQYMPVGSKWRVFIPYYLAYGSTASNGIPAYSTLIFEIYLREITSDN